MLFSKNKRGLKRDDNGCRRICKTLRLFLLGLQGWKPIVKDKIKYKINFTLILMDISISNGSIEKFNF